MSGYAVSRIRERAMRVFLCGFGKFSIAIPMSSISSLTLYARGTSLQNINSPVEGGEVGYSKTAGEDTYISLPGLFGLPSEEIRHGININGDKNKIVLLSTEVECETEIPDTEIYPVPKALDGTLFSSLFSGIKFADNPVFMLNPEQLIQKFQKETAT